MIPWDDQLWDFRQARQKLLGGYELFPLCALRQVTADNNCVRIQNHCYPKGGLANIIQIGRTKVKVGNVK